jgi:hypothetical protein
MDKACPHYGNPETIQKPSIALDLTEDAIRMWLSNIPLLELITIAVTLNLPLKIWAQTFIFTRIHILLHSLHSVLKLWKLHRRPKNWQILIYYIVDYDIRSLKNPCPDFYQPAGHHRLYILSTVMSYIHISSCDHFLFFPQLQLSRYTFASSHPVFPSVKITPHSDAKHVNVPL